MPFDSSLLVIFALAVVVLGLTLQVLRLYRARSTVQVSTKKGSVGYGVVYAFTRGMLPWNKESGRLHPAVFWAGVVYHLGILSAMVLLVQRLLQLAMPPVILGVLVIFAAMGATIGAVNFVRRLLLQELRRLSVLDDYLSLALTSLFLLSAALYGRAVISAPVFDVAFVVLGLYLPLSKVRHMLFFFVSRFYHGAKLGGIGVYAAGVSSWQGPLDPALVPQVEHAGKGAEGVAEDQAGDLARRVTGGMSAAQLAQLGQDLGEEVDRGCLAMINACVHCGMCAEACHYHRSWGSREMMPVEKLDKLARVYRRQHQAGGAVLPLLSGARSLTAESAGELYQAAYERCSLCGRCAMSCPMGINTGQVMTAARVAFARAGVAPEGLSKPAATAIAKGNYLGLPVDDVLENLEWIGEELSDELEQEGIEIPVDRAGAEVLFIPHPLELRDFPLAVMAAAKIFHKAGVSYTFSSKHFDTVNYAYYEGDQAKMKAIIESLLRAQEQIGASKVILSPCGHGYRVLRWEAERIMGRRFPFTIQTFSEAIDELLRQGKITLDKEALSGPITYHDPCNLARNGGVIEEPRRVLRALSSEMVEMLPGGAWNFCCGGGGGLAATGEFGKTRIQAGSAKAGQIRATGAKLVVTNCFNCNTQIKELNKRHSLGIEVKGIVEVVADALV